MANLAGLYGAGRSLPYTKSVNRIMKQQQVIKFLSETSSNRRDSLSLSNKAKSFSKESIAALIDKNANVSREELSYYSSITMTAGRFLMRLILGRMYPVDIILRLRIMALCVLIITEAAR